MKIFGDNIKRERKRHGYSQREFGELIGAAQTTVANYENGVRFPSGEGLVRIAQTLGVSIDYLMGYSVADESILDNPKVLGRFIERLYEFVIEDNKEGSLNHLAKLNPNKDNFVRIHKEVFMKVLYFTSDKWKKHEISSEKKLTVYDLIYELIDDFTAKFGVERKNQLLSLSMGQMTGIRDIIGSGGNEENE